MKSHFLYPLFRRTRPGFDQRDDPSAQQAFMEFSIILYLLPFSLLGLTWLAAATDLSLIRKDLWPIALLYLSSFIIRRKPSVIPIQLQEGNAVTLTSSLSGVALWAGILVWGPTILWVSLLVNALLHLEMAWQRSRFRQDPFWRPFTYFIQEFTGSTLPILVAVALYQALGGSFPYSSAALQDLLLVIAVILLSSFLPGLLFMPILVQINRVILQAKVSIKLIFNFFLNLNATSIATAPFAVLFALLYTRGSLSLFILGLLSLVLINLLAHYLGEMNLRNLQRKREMTQLETLGEEIILSSPERFSLQESLQKHIEVIFQDEQDFLEIHLFENSDLGPFLCGESPNRLIHPPGKDPLPNDLWERLWQHDNAYLILSHVTPAGMRTEYGEAVMVKILSAAPVEADKTQPCIGGIYLLRHKSVARTADSLPAIQALASQVASALYRVEMFSELVAKQKMDQELAFAGKIQASFLPEGVPQIEGWQIAASLTPARQTSGDFYDFIPLGDGLLGVLVADVADKGTGAALYMALSRTLIRTYALSHPLSPAKALQQANERILADTRANQFVTVFYGVLETASGVLTYCNAGHNPSLLLPPGETGAHQALIRTGPPLGLFAELQWETGRAVIQPGETLLLYSDGVTEAQNPAGDFFKESRLLQAARSNLHHDAAVTQAAILEAVQSFMGNSPQFDDITLVVLARS